MTLKKNHFFDTDYSKQSRVKIFFANGILRVIWQTVEQIMYFMKFNFKNKNVCDIIQYYYIFCFFFPPNV